MRSSGMGNNPKRTWKEASRPFMINLTSPSVRNIYEPMLIRFIIRFLLISLLVVGHNTISLTKLTLEPVSIKKITLFLENEELLNSTFTR